MKSLFHRKSNEIYIFMSQLKWFSNLCKRTNMTNLFENPVSSQSTVTWKWLARGHIFICEWRLYWEQFSQFLHRQFCKMMPRLLQLYVVLGTEVVRQIVMTIVKVLKRIKLQERVGYNKRPIKLFIRLIYTKIIYGTCIKS